MDKPLIGTIFDVTKCDLSFADDRRLSTVNHYLARVLWYDDSDNSQRRGDAFGRFVVIYQPPSQPPTR